MNSHRHMHRFSVTPYNYMISAARARTGASVMWHMFFQLTPSEGIMSVG